MVVIRVNAEEQQLLVELLQQHLHRLLNDISASSKLRKNFETLQAKTVFELLTSEEASSLFKVFNLPALEPTINLLRKLTKSPSKKSHRVL